MLRGDSRLRVAIPAPRGRDPGRNEVVATRNRDGESRPAGVGRGASGHRPSSRLGRTIGCRAEPSAPRRCMSGQRPDVLSAGGFSRLAPFGRPLARPAPSKSVRLAGRAGGRAPAALRDRPARGRRRLRRRRRARRAAPGRPRGATASRVVVIGSTAAPADVDTIDEVVTAEAREVLGAGQRRDRARHPVRRLRPGRVRRRTTRAA